MTIQLPNNWTDLPYQSAAWDYLDAGGKRAVILWPRRHGKDDLAMNWTTVAAQRRVGSYWHMLPLATQARKAIWEAVDPHTGRRRIDQAFPKELRESTRDNDMLIRLKRGSTWQVVGSDHYDSLVGTSPAGIVYSEWALSNPSAWTYLSPILEENNGWALFITTPRGENHATKMYDFAKRTPGWFAEHLTAAECGVFSGDDLARIKAEMIDFLGDEEGDAKFRQEYLCDRTAAMPGAYYARLMQRAQDEGRIGEVRHQPGHPVETYWDLGVADDTAIWFLQRVGSMLHVIDYYEGRGEGAPHYVEVCEERRKAGKWIWGVHVGPHDAHVRDWSVGEPRIAVLDRLGLHMQVQGTVSLTEAGYRQDGIDQVRRQLPLCRFDAERCKLGIDALRNYHRAWDDARKVFSKNPQHDWSSHAADAFRVMAMHRPQVRPKARNAPRREYSAWGV